MRADLQMTRGMYWGFAVGDASFPRLAHTVRTGNLLLSCGARKKKQAGYDK